MLALFAAWMMTPAATPPADDPALRALADELARYGSLQAGALERPYYLAATLDDVDEVSIAGSFGALIEHRRDGHRSVNAQVRVGTPALDNTHGVAAGGFPRELMLAMGSTAWEPDYDALRQTLWLALDGEYKRSVEALAAKKAYLQTHTAVDRPADFSPAPVKEMLLPRATLSIDEARWTQVVKRASAAFRAGANVLAGSASLEGEAVNQRFASSDLVRHRFGDTRLTLELRATARADDGMEVTVEDVAVGRTEADLPSDAAVAAKAHELSKRLAALAQAPALDEDYAGPVLFTGQAAATFFLKGLGEPLSRPPPQLERPKTGQLTDRLGKHVTSPLLTVRDDPTLKSYKGEPLLGGFPIDDEGVLPEAITLVDKGVLATYPMSRSPLGKLAKSNGHARGDRGAVSNLIVTGEKPLGRAALKRKLIELAKEEDLPYGLLVDAFEAGGSFEPEQQMVLRMLGHLGGGAAEEIRLPKPLAVYRVFPDGREEPVRGAVFKPVSFRALKDIVAVGNGATVLNTSSYGQPTAVVAPSVLVKQLELKKVSDVFEKEAAIPRPDVR